MLESAGGSAMLPRSANGIEALDALPTPLPSGSAPEHDVASPPHLRHIAFLPRASAPATRQWLLSVLELALIAAWAILIAKPILNFDKHMIPGGSEYWVNVTATTFWDRFQSCGSCALWNGATRGGYPAVADLQAAFLHPIVAIPALAIGWVNGAKVTIALAVFLAGCSQWWLARVLGLGMAARIWSGCLGAAAGSIIGRMEDGAVVLVVCGAACAMMLPPFIQLARDGRLRTAVILGITIALALVSGQAYLQIAFAATVPFALFALLYRNPLGYLLLLRRYLFAGVIGLLLAAPMLVPYLHLLPQLAKDVDPTFSQAQPLAYQPFNFVVDDPDFYRTDVLGKNPFPYIHTSYVGWLAVILAIAGFVMLLNRRRAGLAFALGIMVILPMWIASATPLRWLADFAAGSPTIHDFLIGIRAVPLMSAIAVPPLLGLAAIGLDWLWRSLPRAFRISVDQLEAATQFRFDPRWLLIILLVITTNQAREFGKNWLYLVSDGSAEMGPVLDALETDDLQWVNTPYGVQGWWGLAIQRGMKLAVSPPAWAWDPRTLPVPVLDAEAGPPPEGAFTRKQEIAPYTVYAAAPGNEYAAIVHPDGTRTVCSAHGTGGSIDVSCTTDQPGHLVVLERWTSDWNATIGGKGATVSESGVWIGVDVPAGETTIQLRYQPWDVPVGIVLMFLGLVIAGAAAFWFDRRMPAAAPPIPQGT